MLKRLAPALLAVETALMGVFFVQALRYLIGALYAGFGSASLVAAIDPANVPAGTPGAIHPQDFSNEAAYVVYMLALPLLALIFRRLRFPIILAVGVTVVGRALMLEGTLMTPRMAAALTVGGGLLYLALVIRHRAQLMPYFFILGLGIDQLFRAVGNTLDPSWFADRRIVDVLLSPEQRLTIFYWQFQVFLSVVTFLLCILNYVSETRQRRARQEESAVQPDYGLLPLWGGVGMGALLFVELALLALPNAIAGRAGADYTSLVPFTMAATLLPLVPWVRGQARGFIGLFDSQWRGWLWTLLAALMLVFGTRLGGALGASGLPERLAGNIAAAGLVAAQFMASMMWWWLVRPQAEKERNASGLWLILGTLVFAALVSFDIFTYEYAFVRNLPADFDILNVTVIPLLRGFRGMGLIVLLLGMFLAGLPMIQTQKRIPWASAPPWRSLLALALVVIFSLAAAFAARPPVVTAVRDVSSIRVGSYNIHSGYSEFYSYDLEGIARTIQQSGANVVLLQMVEVGRMTSYGVDQPLWLARRLGMDVRFFATNEGLQGLAVLSNVEIVFDDGALLTSAGYQTGVQRVQIRPDDGVITIYNTWLGFLLESPDRPLAQQEQDQQRQLNEIFGLIRLHHPDGILGRTIVGGTFNNVPDTPLIQSMRDAGFTDPAAGLPLEVAATLRRTRQIARIDYLWIRHLTAFGTIVTYTPASDHGVVVVEIALR
jgi:endonuclease/exonuclease/phosphatase family metal-dependent hydrolase